MKIVASKDFGHAKAPLLPLEVEKEVSAKKEDLTSVYLQTDPGNPNAPTVKFTFPVLDGSKESPREVIQWRCNIDRCVVGLNADTGVKQDALIKQFCKGLALSAYLGSLASSYNAQKAADILRAEAALVPAANAAHAARNQDLADARAKTLTMYLGENVGPGWVRTAANAILTQILPHKILQRVKRYLRREARKPADMKVKTYYMNIQRINDEEIVRLPPNFNAAQKIPADELVDILLFGTPKSWQKEMDRQGFDPLTHTAQQVIDFMERIELTEDFDSDKKVTTVAKKNNNKKKSSSNTTADGTYECMVHGKNNTHDTSDCKTLKAQVKKLKTNNTGGASNNNKKSKNKTWKKESKEKTTDSKKELAALTKQVNELTKQLEVNAIEPVKKHKVKWPSTEEVDEMDLAAIDAELKEFNYGDLDKMDIADDASEDKEDGELDSIKDEVSV